MRIHRLIIIGLVATSLLASCKKEEKPNAHSNLNLDGISFKACTEGGDSNAKTYLDGEAVKWMEGDLILVQNSANQQAPFEVVEGIHTINGTFYTGSTFDLSPAYDAAYPYDKVTLSGTTATFTLPQQQQMTVTGTFGNGTMPMVAHSSNNVLNFYNVCGGVCFPLQGAGKHVSKIVLTSRNTSDKLWGTFTVSTTAVPESGVVTSGPMPTHQSGGSNSVELICNGETGITLTAEPQEFFIMVPPQTMTAGFDVTIYDGATVLYTKGISWDAATHANFIQRSVVSEVETPISIIDPDPLTVTTISPTYITMTSAKGIGTVSGGTPSECGIIYAKASYIAGNTPAEVLTLDNVDNTNVKKLTGATDASFEADMTGLDRNTIYYVRAYAKNGVGVPTYGDDCIPFATRRDYYANETNQGVLRRRTADGDANNDCFEFSVTASKKVYFSTGNLQWCCTGTHAVATGGTAPGTWRFAEYQYDFVGDAAGNNAPGASQTAWMDLFGWGTSGWSGGNIKYQPYSTSVGSSDYDTEHTLDWTNYCPGAGSGENFYAFTQLGNTLYYGYWQLNYANADWGVFNAISNGGNTPNTWYTPQGQNYDGQTREWNYLLNNTSSPRSGYRYAEVLLSLHGSAGDAVSTVNGLEACGTQMPGMIIFPNGFTADNWPADVHPLTTLNSYTSFETNCITEAQWSLLEQLGCVFLPGSGFRFNRSILVGQGIYWSSSRYDPDSGQGETFPNGFQGSALYFNGTIGAPTGHGGKFYGYAVRVVRPAL